MDLSMHNPTPPGSPSPQPSPRRGEGADRVCRKVVANTKNRDSPYSFVSSCKYAIFTNKGVARREIRGSVRLSLYISSYPVEYSARNEALRGAVCVYCRCALRRCWDV